VTVPPSSFPLPERQCVHKARPFTPPPGRFEFLDILVYGKGRNIAIYICLQEGKWSQLNAPDHDTSSELLQHFFADAVSVNNASLASEPQSLYRHGHLWEFRDGAYSEQTDSPDAELFVLKKGTH